MTVERASLARREIHLVVEVSDTTLKCDLRRSYWLMRALVFRSTGSLMCQTRARIPSEYAAQI